MNKKIDCISELKGEYNIKVLEGDTTVYESGWCQNTILSGGLQGLYNQSITSLTGVLDLGTSTLRPGVAGYNLAGIISKPASSIFLNIPRSKHSIYTEKDTQNNNTVRVFYSYFASGVADTAQSFNEFAIKSENKIIAFARNTFKSAVTVQPNQYITMEYRMKVGRRYSFTSNLPFKTSGGQSFTVPCTGVAFNIPYNEMYRKDNELVLLNEATNLPAFGVQWPTTPKYAIRSRDFSIFTPTEIGYSLNNTTRSFTVSTVFSNISARSYGLFNSINTLLLTRSTKTQFEIGLPNSAFLGVKLKFPLALYNYENDFFDKDGISLDHNPYARCRPSNSPYCYYGVIEARYNKFDIGINYTWREVS